VQYKRPDHAKQAIEEYHEGLLDEKVLVVEYDMERQELNPENDNGPKVIYLNN
jgi:RNA recognition motif-containing protein